MELIVLGKYGPFAPARGACSGYLVRHNGVNLLMDCGSGVLSRMQEYIGIKEISAIFLSHLHSDHISDLLIMRYALSLLHQRGESSNAPIITFAPSQPENEYQTLANSGVFEMAELPAVKEFTLGDMEVSFLAMTHPVPSFAIRIEAAGKVLVYTGDTNQNSSIAEFAKKADVLLCDANFLHIEKNRVIPHLTAKEAGFAAVQARVKKLILTHISPFAVEKDLISEAQTEFANTTVAQEMSTYFI